MADQTNKDEPEHLETVGATPDADTVDDSHINYPSSDSAGSLVLLDESVFVELDEGGFADLT